MSNPLWTSVLSVAFIPLLLTACSSSGLGGRQVGDRSHSADGSRANWVDEATHGVGTHRITASDVNVRDTDLSRVRFVADLGDQLVLTRTAIESGGHTYMEGVFKGGDLDGEYGWVASDYLAHTQLTVCGGDAAVRTGSDLGTTVGVASRGAQAYVVSSTVRNTGVHRYFEVSVSGLRGFVATDFLCRAGGGDGSRAGGAQALLDHHYAGRAVLWDSNFGRNDGASALENVLDAAAGLPAQQSCHSGAPCGEVFLDPALLDGMNRLVEDHGYDFFVTSIAGAAHSPGSYHYAGRAMDVDEIDGVQIYGNSARATAFMNACWNLGAVEVFGPSNDPSGHFDHIHCAW